MLVSEVDKEWSCQGQGNSAELLETQQRGRKSDLIGLRRSDSHRAVAYMSQGVSASFHLAPVPIKMPPWQWIK